uniref:MULE transposase domain-containing protein n=1 Tax=Lactuca sativa TaxID=4236 RepID=A0A9R1ULV2_LACSA|nr:hypothetical protein LSAT_V11C800440650 [Lactuca sativa]
MDEPMSSKNMCLCFSNCLQGEVIASSSLKKLGQKSVEVVDEYVEQSSHQNQICSFSGECCTSSNDAMSSSMMSTSCVLDFYMSGPLHDIRPDVPIEFKPTKSMRFKDVDEGVNFYKRYVEKAGFDVRMITLRKRDGYTINKFNRMVKNRKAKIIVKHVKGIDEYWFDKFQENHNHDLEDKFHLKSTRTISYSEKEFIVQAFTVKMGATKAYKLKLTLKGSFQHVRGNVVDYRNFKTNMGSIIGLRDSQLIVNKMNDWKNNYPNYSFYYKCDENKMSCLLVQHFIQTTGLLNIKDVNLYKWLLEQFLKSHSNRQPLLVLTDQDPALKQAVDSVFCHSKHRFYVWHIMKKLPKITDFKKRFNKLVWDMYIECDEPLMKEFNLEDERWFKVIFKNKEAWVPAYFSDFQCAG